MSPDVVLAGCTAGSELEASRKTQGTIRGRRASSESKVRSIKTCRHRQRQTRVVEIYGKLIKTFFNLLTNANLCSSFRRTLLVLNSIILQPSTQLSFSVLVTPSVVAGSYALQAERQDKQNATSSVSSFSIGHAQPSAGPCWFVEPQEQQWTVLS